MKQSLSVCKVFPIPTTAYPTPAKRPHWSVMSKKKINHAFQIDTPHWRQGIQEIMEELASKD
jgi:dTDP-4-dehydrorhamnose reductase